ncbi:TetR/AcrR family transcriptional regulator [Gordonia rubripertincta]|uniref:TetR/AcrR family transcriptional regulator n=1 Tax=Gordonia rubripertincta TaxID=36822 RepID=UPI0039B497D4
MSRPHAPARRPRTDGLRNRERLLEIGREQLWDRGFDLSAAAVATAAGVGIGTLYRHFATRDDLIEAVLADLLTEVESELDEVESMSSAFDAVQRYSSTLTLLVVGWSMWFWAVRRTRQVWRSAVARFDDVARASSTGRTRRVRFLPTLHWRTCTSSCALRRTCVPMIASTPNWSTDSCVTT